MLLPSISMVLAGAGVLALLFVANWLVWSLPRARPFRINPKALFLAGPPTLADLYVPHPRDHHGFKDVA